MLQIPKLFSYPQLQVNCGEIAKGCYLYAMTGLETGLDTIKALAVEREDENYRFREFLQQQDSTEVDKAVVRLNDKITPAIDCRQCGNCCRTLLISILPEERPFFAKHFNLPEEMAAEQYLSQSIGGNTIMCQVPCVFLRGNECSEYENRFTDCREFPHLHQPGFVQRSFSMLMHYGTCPIIFNVWEQLKDNLQFDR